jgi:hypothetical protein
LGDVVGVRGPFVNALPENTRTSPRPSPACERGTSLILVCAAILIVSGVVFAGIDRMQADDSLESTRFVTRGQAYAVARAGLVDALAWLRRQTSQPVTDFAPTVDLTGEVPIYSTDNPSLGLMRSFELSPGIWARYEVRRGRPMDPFTDLNRNGVHDEGEPFEDLGRLPETATPEEQAEQILVLGHAQAIQIRADAQARADALRAAAEEEAAQIIADAADDTPDEQVKAAEKAEKLITEAEKEAAKTLRDGEKDATKAIEAAERDAANVLKNAGVKVVPGQLHLDPEVIQSMAMLPVEVTRPTAVTMSDGYGDGEWTPAQWSRDVGAERGVAGAGAVWRLESRALVYRMVDPFVAPGDDPNRILGQATLATEVRRLVIVPPAAAAICAPQPSSVTLGSRTRVHADQLAVGVAMSGGSVLQISGSEVTAPTVSAVIPSYADSVSSVFGVLWAELRSMADQSVSAGTDPVPSHIDTYTLVTIEGDAVFNAKRPLRGKGILAVKGDLTVEEGSNTFFNGLIYVDGNVTINAPAFLRGSIICTGEVLLQGTGIDYVEMEYDPDLVSDLLRMMGQYRVTRAIYEPDRRLTTTK